MKQHFSTGRAGCSPPKLVLLTSALRCFPQQLLGSTHTQPTLSPQPQDTATLIETSISPLIWRQHYKSRILGYLISPYDLSAAGPVVRNGPQGRRATNHGKGVTWSCPEETHLHFIVSVTRWGQACNRTDNKYHSVHSCW